MGPWVGQYRQRCVLALASCLPLDWLPSLPSQRYLDEAEKEKQQYLKELWAYQQSEAYKVCTEKIQENKIKKGESHTGSQVGTLLWRVPEVLADLSSSLPFRGLQLWAHEHPPEWSQGKGLSGQSTWGKRY